MGKSVEQVTAQKHLSIALDYSETGPRSWYPSNSYSALTNISFPSSVWQKVAEQLRFTVNGHTLLCTCTVSGGAGQNKVWPRQ